MKAMAALREGYYLRIWDDSSLFWYSLWSDHSPLCDQVFAIDIHDINLQIKDLYVNNQWQWDLLYTHVPNQIKYRLSSICLQLNHDVQYDFTWNSLEGVYTAKEGYNWLTSNSSSSIPSSLDWQWIWRL